VINRAHFPAQATKIILVLNPCETSHTSNHCFFHFADSVTMLTVSLRGGYLRIETFEN